MGVEVRMRPQTISKTKQFNLFLKEEELLRMHLELIAKDEMLFKGRWLFTLNHVGFEETVA